MAAGTMLTRLAIEAGFLTPDEARRLSLADMKAAAVIETFAERGVTEDQIAMLLACALQLPYVAVDRLRIADDVVARIPLDVQLRYEVVPVRVDSDLGSETLYVAMRPERSAAVSTFLTNLLKVPVVPVAASAASIRRYHDFVTGKKDAPSSFLGLDEVDLDLPASPFEIGLVRQAGKAN